MAFLPVKDTDLLLCCIQAEIPNSSNYKAAKKGNTNSRNVSLLKNKELKYWPLRSHNKYAHYTSSSLCDTVLAWIFNTSSFFPFGICPAAA